MDDRSTEPSNRTGQHRAWVMQLVVGDMTDDLELGQRAFDEMLAIGDGPNVDAMAVIDNLWCVLTQFAHEVALKTVAAYQLADPTVDPVQAAIDTWHAYEIEARVDGSAVSP
jgi:hypothetical protein